MTFQILVNHFNEDQLVVRRFLSSLSKQKGVEFTVLILSDGGNLHLSKEDLTGFPFLITYAYNTHSGVCHTRNILLNKSNADYVMFCDIDDQFFDPYGLKSIFDAAKKNQYDVIGTPYYAEKEVESKYFYQILNKDVLRVHGKLFRRQYLIDNDIRFPDSMETSGDMMFLWLAFQLTNKIKWVNKVFYIWKWNKNSVTRGLPYYHIQTYNKMLKCYSLLAEDLKKRKLPSLYQGLLSTVIATIYIDFTSLYWESAPQDIKINAETSGKLFLDQYLEDYLLVSEDIRRNGYQTMINYTTTKYQIGDDTCFSNMKKWLFNHKEKINCI